MTTNILSDNWRGKFAKPIDPAAVRFTITQAEIYADCQGCMFSGQRSEVCDQANEIAREAGIQGCEDPLPNGCSGVYVLDKSDPRQIQIELIQGEVGAAVTGPTSITKNHRGNP